MSANTEHAAGSGEHLAILVGAPDPLLRQRLTSALRLRGHEVLEAANAQDMRDRLTEHADSNGQTARSHPVRGSLCGEGGSGTGSAPDLPESHARLGPDPGRRAPIHGRAAQRLGANAVMGELPVVEDLWEILKKAASGPHSPSDGQT